MKKKSIITVLFICLIIVSGVMAESDYGVIVKHGQSYMCGDSFEIILPDQPSTTKMITRDPFRYINAVYVHAEAGNDDILLQVRIKIRNLTPMIYKGLSKESFQMTGYIRNRHVTYLPEIMEPYDMGSYESYTLYSPNHNTWSYLPPLRMDDILLVYRVNPILINWELHVEPQTSNGTSYEYGTAVYEPMEQEACDAVFQFPSIRDGITGATITYIR